MYGWRARLGLMVPAGNTVNEPEFYGALPEGISLHTARMVHSGANVESVEGMTADIPRAAEYLATADVDVAVFGCTTGSLLEGVGHAEEIEEEIRGAAGVPAVATSTSIRRAFDALGMRSLAVTTPYIEELNEAEAAFLDEAGYEVVDMSGLGHEWAHSDLHPSVPYREAQALDHDEADGVFVSCTNYRTFEVIERLEADLGKPVVTSNQATLWDALRTAGVDYSGIDLGRLFDI